MTQKIFSILFCLSFCAVVSAQSPDSLTRALAQFQGGKYLNRIDAQVSGMNSQVTAQSQKYLQRFAAEEEALKTRLAKVDPTAANSLFGDAGSHYADMQASVSKGSLTSIPGAIPGAHLPSLDSLKNTLLFLQLNKDKIPGMSGAQAQRLTASIANVEALENRMQVADNLKNWLGQRKAYLSQQLGKYGMAGQVGRCSKMLEIEAYGFDKKPCNCGCGWGCGLEGG